MNTYQIALDVNYEGVEEGDRVGSQQAALEAVIAFRQTLAQFIIENELHGQITLVDEQTAMGMVTVQTTAEIKSRLEGLQGVMVIVDGHTPMRLL